ncbi:hypothetical protein [Gimesia sp.]|uniref:hypothetical protein n=1 Tax=Gimesia sp. TaxID=2024833 RepID=UPI003A908CC4
MSSTSATLTTVAARLRSRADVSTMDQQCGHDGRADQEQQPGLGSPTKHGGGDQDGK